MVKILYTAMLAMMTFGGGKNDDVLYGGDGDDYLEGNGGEDFLDGGVGFDNLDGGRGVDKCINYESHKRCNID